MSLITEGLRKGKIMDYGLMETKKKEAMVFINWKIQDEDARVYDMRWTSGFWTTKSTEITIESLMTLGLQTHEQIAQLAAGKPSGILNTDVKYDVMIQHIPDYKDSTKMVGDIKWFNKEGEAAKRQDEYKLDVAKATRMLQSVSLGAAMTNVKQKLKGEGAADAAAPTDLDKIPF